MILKIITIGLTLSMLVLGIILIYSGITQKTGTNKVPCYDRYGNKILGQECIKKTNILDNLCLIFGGIVLCLISLMAFKPFWEAANYFS